MNNRDFFMNMVRQMVGEEGTPDTDSRGRELARMLQESMEDTGWGEVEDLFDDVEEKPKKQSQTDKYFERLGVEE